MTWFSLGRAEGFPSNYGEQLTAAHVDVLVAGLILAVAIVAVACASVLPAYTANRRWISLATYWGVCLFIGGIVLVCNFGQQWEVGHASIRSPYKPASPIEMEGEIGLHISLRGVNLTLRGELRHDSPAAAALSNEVIDYNEHFSWEWAQGRFGFGPYAGRFSREYRAAVVRGSPIPILVTAEYFTFDGEGLRFGRHYRLAGYYAHFFMWTAFCAWVLANISFFMVVRLGAIFLTAAGVAQVIAVILWSSIRNSIEIQVPFESAGGSHEVLLSTRYGPDFWLVVVNGVLCSVGGIVLLVLDDFYKEELCKIFGIDPLSIYVYEYKTIDDTSAGVGEELDLRNPPSQRMTVESEYERGSMGVLEEKEEDEEGGEEHDRPVVYRRRQISASHSAKTSLPPVVVQLRRTHGKSIYNAFTRRSRVPTGIPTWGMAGVAMEAGDGTRGPTITDATARVVLNLQMHHETEGRPTSKQNGRPLTSTEI